MWILAKDVCEALGDTNYRRSAGRLDEDEKGVSHMITPGGTQEITVITEAGLYSLILRSHKPEARAFKRWVTHEVLPAICKHGMYATLLAQGDAVSTGVVAKQMHQKGHNVG